MISNILRESKVVEIQGVSFSLKKWPARLRNWLTLRMVDGAELSEDGSTYINVHPMARPFEKIEEEIQEKVYLGVDSWGVRDEKECPVPINRDSVRELYQVAPGVFSALLLAVEEFNNPLTEKQGESLPPTSTT